MIGLKLWAGPWQHYLPTMEPASYPSTSILFRSGFFGTAFSPSSNHADPRLSSRNTPNGQELHITLCLKILLKDITLDILSIPVIWRCKSAWRFPTSLFLRFQVRPTKSRQNGWRMGVSASMSRLTKISKRTFEIRWVAWPVSEKLIDRTCLGVNLHPCRRKSDYFHAVAEFVR